MRRVFLMEIRKVEIHDDGIIVESSKEIGKFSGFMSTDFVKKPYSLKKHKIKLYSGTEVKLAYGGLYNGEFCETCHLQCKWAKNCVGYKKGICRENPNFENIGFYIFE